MPSLQSNVIDDRQPFKFISNTNHMQHYSYEFVSCYRPIQFSEITPSAQTQLKQQQQQRCENILLNQFDEFIFKNIFRNCRWCVRVCVCVCRWWYNIQSRPFQSISTAHLMSVLEYLLAEAIGRHTHTHAQAHSHTYLTHFVFRHCFIDRALARAISNLAWAWP